MAAKRSSWWAKLVAVVLVEVLVFGGGCAGTSRINTTPEGGKVYVNGMYIGDAPTIFKYRSGLPETYILEIKKDGYKPLTNATIDRTLRADESLLLLLLVFIPYFFSARLEDQYVFQMEPEKGTPPAPANPLKAPGTQ